jgi:hypothetical protein
MGLALLHVAGGRVDGSLGDPYRLGADGWAAAVEGVHGNGEALTLLAHPVDHGDPDLVEGDGRRRAPPQPHLVLVGGDLDPPSGLDHETADAPPTGRRVGHREDRVNVGDPGVGDPVLGPGQEVVIAVPHGPGPHGGHVTSGIGLGQAVAALPFARRQPGKVPASQLLGTPVDDGKHAQLGDEHGQGGGGTDPGQLLGHHRLGHQIGPRPAVLGGNAQGRELELDAGVERLLGIDGLSVGLGRMGGHTLLGESPEAVPELELGGAQGEGRRVRVHPPKLLSGRRAAGLDHHLSR